MKTSWIIGVFMFYMLIVGIAMMVASTNTPDSDVMSIIDTLIRPSIVNQAGSASAFVSFVRDIGTYFMAFLGALFLYFPSVWQGHLIWFYYFVCIPVSVGMVLSIVTILRGVHAS